MKTNDLLFRMEWVPEEIRKSLEYEEPKIIFEL